MLPFLLAAASTGSEVAVPLSPLTAWRVSYEDSMCILSRPFGAAASPVTLAFRRTPLDYEKTFLVVLMTPPDKKGLLVSADATLTLAPSDASASGKATSAMLADGRGRLSLFTIAGDAVNGIADAKTVTITIAGLPTVSVAPTATAAALRALDQCGRDVAVRWGVPAAEFTVIRTPPTPKNVLNVFGSDAYPAEAIRRGEQSQVTALLSLNAHGRVTECTIKAPSGSRSLDEVSCALSLKMLYTPALDKEGAPVASHAGLRVNWVLPGRRTKK